MKLTLDANIQYLINKELNKALVTFNATGAASLLMDVNSIFQQPYQDLSALYADFSLYEDVFSEAFFNYNQPLAHTFL